MSESLTRAELEQRLAEVRIELVAARARRDRAAIAYAGTPDGMAETVRRWELAAAAERPALGDLVAAGVAAADEEYLARLVKTSDGVANSDQDGLLRALLLPPAGDPLAEVLIGCRIMGTFRQSDRALTTGVSQVTLLRLTGDGQRVRGAVQHRPALLADDTSVHLGQVIREAVRTGDGMQRLQRLLGTELVDRVRVAAEVGV